MSKVEILAELPRLSHEERREIMREMLKYEEESEALEVSRHSSDAAFQQLDELEANDDAS